MRIASFEDRGREQRDRAGALRPCPPIQVYSLALFFSQDMTSNVKGQVAKRRVVVKSRMVQAQWQRCSRRCRQQGFDKEFVGEPVAIGGMSAPHLHAWVGGGKQRAARQYSEIREAHDYHRKNGERFELAVEFKLLICNGGGQC